VAPLGLRSLDTQRGWRATAGKLTRPLSGPRIQERLTMNSDWNTAEKYETGTPKSQRCIAWQMRWVVAGSLLCHSCPVPICNGESVDERCSP
jgi:hypothetical protein